MSGGTALDSSVIVAAFQEWHQDHARCLTAVDRALADPPVILPLQVVVESYSVLTRLPAPHRLRPQVVRQLLEGTFRDFASLAPAPRDAWDLLARLSEGGVAGGAVYDAAIAESALQGGADEILTLNARDFERVAPVGLTVVSPPSV